MKKIIIVSLAMLIGISQSAFTQNTEKTNQASLFNEVYGGYGAGSLFYFTGRMSHGSDYITDMYAYNDGYLTSKTFTDPSSAGTFFVGYGRTLNRVISLGFMFGFQQFSYTGKAHYVINNSGYATSDTVVSLSNHDNLLNGMARVQFCYVNKPAIKLYSGVGIGITVNFSKGKIGPDEYTDRKLYPGGQLTLMGIRFGRAFGGFFEFGFGTYGIINAGISYKIND